MILSIWVKNVIIQYQIQLNKNDFEKFKEELPSKEKFYSLLIDGKISDKEYEHVFNVWKNFEIKTMKDYHDFYLKYDILLLADVFEKF